MKNNKEVHNKLQIEKGAIFNNLTVISEVLGYTLKCGVSKRAFLCKCVCDLEKVFILDSLRGGVKSCGCINRVENKIRDEDYHLKKEIFIRYYGIKARCNNPKNLAYVNYGGRGIKLGEEWDTPAKFYEWCINNGYKKELAVDRIDNNGNYTPNNCRFITVAENALNTRRSIPMEIVYELFEGIYKNKKTSEVSHATGYGKSTLNRILKRDYSKQLEKYKNENTSRNTN